MNKNDQIWIAVILLIAIVIFIFKDDLFGERSYDVELPDSFSFDPADANIYGCTDPQAENYMPDANTMGDREFACFYNYGCCDVGATNWDANADSCWQNGNNEYLCNYSGVTGEYGTYENTMDSLAMRNDGCYVQGANQIGGTDMGFGVTTPIVSMDTVAIQNWWDMGGGGPNMPNSVCVNQPNDCSCANMHPDTYTDCMSDNAHGIIRTNEYCIGSTDGSRYCNATHYQCNGPLPPYA
jgi:hypothetical protein